jgi:hypothetical protein
VSDHALKLESDVLDDMRQVSASLKPDDESAGLADAAAVIAQSRHCRHQCGSNAGDI